MGAAVVLAVVQDQFVALAIRGAYTRFEENLRYSARRLLAVWPSRFKTLAQALPYAWDASDPDREDVALANKVYGDRMGNETNGTDDNDGGTRAAAG